MQSTSHPDYDAGTLIGVCEHGKALHYRYPCPDCLAAKGLTQAEYFDRLEAQQKLWANKVIPVVDNL